MGKVRSKLLVVGSALLGFIAIATISSTSPPHALDAKAPSMEFSAGRAMRIIDLISKEPHPVGSMAHERVAAIIFEELKKLGITPYIQETVSGALTVGIHKVSSIRNIYAKIPGTGNSKAILLSSHYDSVAGSRGASDDGSGVATLLETARALKHSSALKNDIILLFTDAEEEFLLGAVVFTHSNPWKNQIGLALNFEARGSHGPSAMFQTTGNNGFLIKGLAKVAPYPIANSVVSSISKALPNETDLLVFKRSGLLGLDFAYADGLNRYHSYHDSAETIDPKSLQHHGSYALSLARYFGMLDLHSIQRPDLVYFDVFGKILIDYSQWFARVLGFLTLGAFIAVFLKYRKTRDSKKVSPLKLWIMALAPWLLVLIATGLYNALLSTIKDPSLFINYPTLFIWPYLLITVGIFLLLISRYEKNWGIQSLTFGTLYPWAALTLLTSLFAPTASYFFQWCLLSSLTAYVVRFTAASKKETPLKILGTFVVLIPAVFFSSGLAYGLFTMENGGGPALTALVVTLGLGLIIPVISFIPIEYRKRAGMGLIPIGIILGLILTGFCQFSGNKPQQSHIMYGVDVEKNQAFWFTQEHQPRWVEQFIRKDSEELPLPSFSPSIKPVRFSPAPLLNLLAPEIEVVSDQTENAVRNLVFKIHSKRNARCIQMWEETGIPISKTAVDGNVFKAFARFSPKIDRMIWEWMTSTQSKSEWKFNFCAVPSQGFTLAISLPAETRPVFRIVDETLGLPQFEHYKFLPRPPEVIPDMWSDRTLVSRTLKL